MEGQAVTADAEGQAQQRQLWLRAGLLWAAVALAILGLYRDTTTAMMETWWISASYQHCMLIPLIVAFLVWERRPLFALTVPAPSAWGLAALAGAGLLWLMGRLVGALVVQELALVLSLQALVLAIFGWQIVRALIFPLFFMLFLVPAGDVLVQPLQNITADMSVWLLQVLGVPTYREGVFISTPSGNFHVAEACSGVRYLVAMVPLGALFANMSFVSWWRRAGVMALAVIVPIIANGIRAFGIIYIAYLTDNEYAIGVDHLIYGWIFFALVTLALIGIGMLFADKPLDAPAADYGWVKAPAVTPAVNRGAMMAASAAAIAALWSVTAMRLDAVPDQVAVPEMTPPATAAPWRYDGPAQENDWSPVFNGAAASQTVTYVRDTDGARVILYYAYYPYQREGAELVQFGNTISPKDWDWNGDRAIVHDGKPVSESHVADLGKARMVWSWYWVGGRQSADPRWAKLHHLWARLSGGNDSGAIVAFSTDVGHRAEDAPRTLADFLDHVDSALPGFPEKR